MTTAGFSPIPKGEYLYNENISQNAGWTKVEK